MVKTMYVKIGTTNYTKLKNLSFMPQVDIVGDSIPINEFSVQIKTTDEIKVGQWAYLYDDLNDLWAKYWIMFSDRVDASFIQIKAQSIVALLDRVYMDAAIYPSGVSAGTIIAACFTAAGVSSNYTVESSVSSASVTGYFPEQTARERLQWVCFATGAYVKQHSGQNVEIKKLDQSSLTYIPTSQTFWKPQIDYRDYVTKISITTYSFEAGTPDAGDQYVTVGDTNYIYTTQKITLTNGNAPETALPSEINIDGCYIMTDDNADDVASRLAMLYFARTEVSADIINNNEYYPPKRVGVHVDEGLGAVGYIESADFKFGLQARSTLKVVASETVPLAELVINYVFNGATVATRTYNFPVGYEYSILNPYVDVSSGEHRYVYRPLTEYCEGTMTSGVNTKTVQCELALHWYSEYQLLRIISVSDVEFDSGDATVVIG